MNENEAVVAWLISTFHHPITGNLITKGILTDTVALKSEEYVSVVGLSQEFPSDRAWADLPDRLREMVSAQQVRAAKLKKQLHDKSNEIPTPPNPSTNKGPRPVAENKRREPSPDTDREEEPQVKRKKTIDTTTTPPSSKPAEVLLPETPGFAAQPQSPDCEVKSPPRSGVHEVLFAKEDPIRPRPTIAAGLDRPFSDLTKIEKAERVNRSYMEIMSGKDLALLKGKRAEQLEELDELDEAWLDMSVRLKAISNQFRGNATHEVDHLNE